MSRAAFDAAQRTYDNMAEPVESEDIADRRSAIDEALNCLYDAQKALDKRDIIQADIRMADAISELAA